MAGIKQVYLEGQNFPGSQNGSKNKQNRRDTLVFLGAAGLLASFGYLGFDGPEKGKEVNKETQDLHRENLKYVKAVDEFVKLVNDFNDKIENKSEAFITILESYFNLVNLFGKTYGYAKSFPLEVKEVIGSHKNDFNFQANQLPEKFKIDLKKFDSEMALHFSSMFFPEAQNEEQKDVDILTLEQIKDPWTAFDKLDSSFVPASVQLKDFRLILTKMSALLGVMYQKSGTEVNLQNKYNIANKKFITYKNNFLKQLRYLNKK